MATSQETVGNEIVTTKTYQKTEQKVEIPTKTHLAIRIICFLTSAATIYVLAAPNRNSEISREYFIRVIPPGLFFSIWGAIYITFYLSALYALTKDVWEVKAWVLFSIWNIFGAVWTALFNAGTRATVAASVPMLFIILFSNQLLWISLVTTPQMDNCIGFLIKNFYGIGLGWLIAATNLGIGYLSVHYMGSTLDQQLISFWVIAPAFYIAFYLFNMIRYPVKFSIGLILTTIWALTGALISSLRHVPQDIRLRID